MDDLTSEELEYISGWSIFFPRNLVEPLLITTTTEEKMQDMFRSLINKGYLVSVPFRRNNSPLIAIYLSDKSVKICELVANYYEVL